MKIRENNSISEKCVRYSWGYWDNGIQERSPGKCFEFLVHYEPFQKYLGLLLNGEEYLFVKIMFIIIHNPCFIQKLRKISSRFFLKIQMSFYRLFYFPGNFYHRVLFQRQDWTMGKRFELNFRQLQQYTVVKRENVLLIAESECINNKEKDDSLPEDSKSLKHEILRNHH